MRRTVGSRPGYIRVRPYRAPSLPVPTSPSPPARDVDPLGKTHRKCCNGGGSPRDRTLDPDVSHCGCANQHMGPPAHPSPEISNTIPQQGNAQTGVRGRNGPLITPPSNRKAALSARVRAPAATLLSVSARPGRTFADEQRRAGRCPGARRPPLYAQTSGRHAMAAVKKPAATLQAGRNIPAASRRLPPATLRAGGNWPARSRRAPAATPPAGRTPPGRPRRVADRRGTVAASGVSGRGRFTRGVASTGHAAPHAAALASERRAGERRVPVERGESGGHVGPVGRSGGVVGYKSGDEPASPSHEDFPEIAGGSPRLAPRPRAQAQGRPTQTASQPCARATAREGRQGHAALPTKPGSVFCRASRVLGGGYDPAGMVRAVDVRPMLWGTWGGRHPLRRVCGGQERLSRSLLEESSSGDEDGEGSTGTSSCGGSPFTFSPCVWRRSLHCNSLFSWLIPGVCSKTRGLMVIACNSPCEPDMRRWDTYLW
jgi:hypothetical protein